MVWKPEANPNYKRRNFTGVRLGRSRSIRMPTSSELEANKVRQNLREDEADVSDILASKHMREVRKHMPAIREAREKGKQPRRVPKKVLETVERLKLV